MISAVPPPSRIDLPGVGRVVIGTALLMSITTPATAASAEAAPYVQIIVNRIISWQTSEGTDEIYITMSGPSFLPAQTRTVRVWPGATVAYGTKPNNCFSPEGYPCPPGTTLVCSPPGCHVPGKPSFRANGGWAHIDIWDQDMFGDDLLFSQYVKLDPLTSVVDQRFRMGVGGADYELTIALVPSWNPL
ncbi:hypothetical protein [Microbispora sp. CA-102843]|uniref:hypothetical protein n=1 Tax=Microbispora sp. CA-102843 TaxID=3239952 RepID=UPI003D91DD95